MKSSITNRKYLSLISLTLFIFLLSNALMAQNGFVIDHNSTDLSDIPDSWITQAKADLHIAYKHTSHGSQLITGMNALEAFPDFGTKYAWDNNSQGDNQALSLHDNGIPDSGGDLGYDGDPDGNGIAQWAEGTYDFLDDTDNYHINVILWSWCNIGGHNIPRYLNSMEYLIGQFSEGGTHPRATSNPVQFVFITGHANGGGEGDSSDTPNELIRAHVTANNRILFDFSDIENYDPDNNYYLNKRVTDALYYDNEAPYDTGDQNANWASEYLANNNNSELDQLTTGDDVSGYSGCGSCSHSDGPNNDARLNCILKGRAVWHLFARLTGWNGSLDLNEEISNKVFTLYQNAPNPFGNSTNIKYRLQSERKVEISIYNILGKKISTLVDEVQTADIHQVSFNSDGLSNGIYFYRITTGDIQQTRRMILIR